MLPTNGTTTRPTKGRGMPLRVVGRIASTRISDRIPVATALRARAAIAGASSSGSAGAARIA